MKNYYDIECTTQEEAKRIEKEIDNFIYQKEKCALSKLEQAAQDKIDKMGL